MRHASQETERAPSAFDPDAVRAQVLAAAAGLQECQDRGDRDGAARFLSEAYVYNDIAANRITKAQLPARRDEDRRLDRLTLTTWGTSVTGRRESRP